MIEERLASIGCTVLGITLGLFVRVTRKKEDHA